MQLKETIQNKTNFDAIYLLKEYLLQHLQVKLPVYMKNNSPETSKEKELARKRRYYQAHSEEILQKQKENRLAHKEEKKAYNRQYRSVHKERINELQREHYQANRESYREKAKLYRENNKDSLSKASSEYRKANREKFTDYERSSRNKKAKELGFKDFNQKRRYDYWCKKNNIEVGTQFPEYLENIEQWKKIDEDNSNKRRKKVSEAPDGV